MHRVVLFIKQLLMVVCPLFQWLAIAKNFFTGAMPSQVGNLVKLRNLAASDNLFEGTSPS